MKLQQFVTVILSALLLGSYSPGASAQLDEKEKSSLVFMREEEKLARDVYDAMYEKYRLRIFLNIRASEQNHMDALARALMTYQVEDPVTNNERGVFKDPVLQRMYADLIVWGNKSKRDALEVGVYIEETDIVDLQKAINETDEKLLISTYGNLMDGSKNHLAAFKKLLER